MKRYSISQLARSCGLSRSTLLYYDRLGLLSPAGRSAAGYRCYGERERRRLERICEFRQAGLALGEIRSALDSGGLPNAGILARRMQETSRSISLLKTQHQLLAVMSARSRGGRPPAKVDKLLWTEMLRAAGMDAKGMARWHAEFERRAPEAHREFLFSLGLAEPEVSHIQQWSRRQAVV